MSSFYNYDVAIDFKSKKPISTNYEKTYFIIIYAKRRVTICSKRNFWFCNR